MHLRRHPGPIGHEVTRMRKGLTTAGALLALFATFLRIGVDNAW